MFSLFKKNPVAGPFLSEAIQLMQLLMETSRHRAR